MGGMRRRCDVTELDLLRRFVKGGGAGAVCPGCGAGWAGDGELTDLRCPTCGVEVALQLRPVEPKLGWWMAMLVPVTLGSGMGVLGLLMTIKTGWDHPTGIAVFLILFMLNIPCAGLVLAWRRRVAGWPLLRRWLGVAGAWLMFLVPMMGIALTMR